MVKMLDSGEIDFITFTSSSTVRNFMSVIGGDAARKASGCKVVCIGPVTAGTAEKLGIKVAAVADRYTIEGLTDKLMEIVEG